MEGLGERLPSVLANLGQACYNCSKEKNTGVTLQRCTGCRRVFYCGAACQSADWKKHKGLCKAYKTLEANYGHEIVAQYMLLDMTNIDKLHNCLENVSSITTTRLESELRRKLSTKERNLVGWEPRCLACGRSDAIFRIEASVRDRQPDSSGLQPCPDCQLSFYCSEDHWNAVKTRHQHGPCQDGRDGFSHCAMNKLAQQDARLAQFMAGANAGEFKWAPERTLPSWKSLRGVDWNDFEADLAEDFGQIPGLGPLLEPLLRGTTEVLSMPMTILWGLENLYPDDIWTKKDTLNIHVLGAAAKETLASQMFEEILHRLPLVKTLKLMFCGPELEGITGQFSKSMEMDTCPECSRNGRRRIHDHHPQTYHHYISSQIYTKPDLAVAFNSGCSQEDVELWKETLNALVQHKVPTLFTAFNQEEAEAEADLLRTAGATLHPELGPRYNPWGSLVLRIEPSKVIGFYAANGWLAGGFKFTD
ncbi:hypothetical protein GALMADRAFT_155137 [Galerina marginata CBS 339.88]|uniref:MYND-type domain-containing protein n=1 Tax=Galerina marginata (strain CBS 339.88) TaxID=685588 RepID=A0A067T4M4_GALM3|nr:hypothetical protein GALMADRAFT_155137 [Galerina marginata CBS 339.88]